MKPFLSDPVVLICSGIFLIGFFTFFWAIAKFRRLLKSTSASTASFDDILSPSADMSGLNRGTPPVRSSSFSTPVSAGGSSTVVSKEVSDRLDGMTQRLAEMQALLNRQASTAPSDPSAHAGAMGQGFSPETIDKLLKIIGNVVQQVDILQKNLNPAREGPGAKAENPAASASKP